MDTDYRGLQVVRKKSGVFQEYAPFVFVGLMLIAACAFAGKDMGKNAVANSVSPAGLHITILGDGYDNSTER